MYCFFPPLCKQMSREETWEAFIADTLFFGKVSSLICLVYLFHFIGYDLQLKSPFFSQIFLIALTLIMDYHLTLWYLVVFSGIIVAYLAKIIL